MTRRWTRFGSSTPAFVGDLENGRLLGGMVASVSLDGRLREALALRPWRETQVVLALDGNIPRPSRYVVAVVTSSPFRIFCWMSSSESRTQTV